MSNCNINLSHHHSRVWAVLAVEMDSRSCRDLANINLHKMTLTVPELRMAVDLKSPHSVSASNMSRWAQAAAKHAQSQLPTPAASIGSGPNLTRLEEEASIHEVSGYTQHRCSPLYAHCHFGNVEIVKDLLALNVNINHKNLVRPNTIRVARSVCLISTCGNLFFLILLNLFVLGKQMHSRPKIHPIK
jgi:hypothetical protein